MSGETIRGSLVDTQQEGRGGADGGGRAMLPPVEPLAYSIPQAAAALSVSERQVYVLAKRDGLPTVKIGGRRLVRVADLRAWLAAQPVLREDIER